jgi:tetratricopeptide (TPR) repeat protein
LRNASIGETFASPIDATMPLPRDLQSLTGDSQQETEAVTASSAFASTTPALQKDDVVDDETMLVASVTQTPPVVQTSHVTQTLPVAQTSALTPLHVTGFVSDDEQTVFAPPSIENQKESERVFTARQTQARQAQARRTQPKGWHWWLTASACVATLAAASTLVALSFAYRSGVPADGTGGSAAVEAPDARNESLRESLRLTTEAERLLAAGAIEDALTKLREAVRLDERNARAQLQLGAALERTGRRSEAIVFYQAVSALTPNDPQAWQLLAEAQFAENRFADAAQSYRQFFDLTETANGGTMSRANDAIRRRYEEALRLMDEGEQAQSLLTQVVAAPALETSAGKKNEDGITVLPVASPILNPAAHNASTVKLPPPPASSNASVRDAAEKESVETRLSLQERFERAVRLYSIDRQAAVKEFESVASRVPDAHYYLGLARTEGHTLQTIHRAILLDALKHLQIAQSAGGRYSAQAKRLADQLGREYDRRRKEGGG